MYLSNLEIFGFKSFANKTVVNFNEGVTSIVGPNGCGKTNIVDAIRWCLGEQRSSALRSDKMENVIFNGTASKKPMGMAEVSLTIENTKGILPIEYTDITITRRIFRSGESEYLLNKNICRLKDIVNLFMDTGIGSNAYSVIELKMVETILSNKAEERRTMFEEAAGVNKYKLRRRLALRKLDEVKNDLTRVNDIVTEVAKTVSSLERQAKKADRYNKISSTLRELELDLAARELALFNVQSKQFQLNKEQNLEKKINLESELNRLTDEIKTYKQKLSQAEDVLNSKRFELKQHVEKMYEVKSIISVSSERKNALEKNVEKYSQELDELHGQLGMTKNGIEKNQTELTELAKLTEQKLYDQKLSGDKVKDFKNLVDEKRSEIKKQSDFIVEKHKVVSAAENDYSNIEKVLEEKNNAIHSLNDKILQLTSDVAKTVGYIECLKDEKKEVSKRIAEVEDVHNRSQQEKKRLEDELSKLKTGEVELKGLITGINDKILFIRNLIENLEGFSKGTKELLKNNSWTKSDFALLVNVGTSGDKHKKAIEAALQNNLNNLIVTSIDDLKSGIEFLKNNNLGRASFYLSDNSGQNNKSLAGMILTILIKKRRKKIEKANGFIGWASDFIDTELKWKSSFNKLLNDTAVVDSLGTALKFSSSFHDFGFTTLAGDFVDKNGVINSGSPPQVDESLFGRKQFLDKLNEALPHKQRELNHLSQQIEKLEDKLSKIDLNVLSDEGKMLLNDMGNIDKQISQFEYEKKKANDEIELLHKQIKNLAAEANLIDNNRNKASENLARLTGEKKIAEDDQLKIEIELKKIENEFEQLTIQDNDLNLELERLYGERKTIENTIKQSAENLDLIQATIVKRGDDIRNDENEISSAQNLTAEKQEEFEALESNGAILRRNETEIEIEYRKLQKTINEIDTAQSEIRNNKELILDEIRDADIKLNEIKIKQQNLADNINENYSITLELKPFDDLDSFNFKERSDEVHELKQRIKGLGPINLLAYSEYEEEKNRFDFLNKQRDDLVASEKDIVMTIEEINATAQTQFMETFQKIRENFIKVFRTLFDPGDEVDLWLEENSDPLEAKIEIIAKPKGKRPTSIELLSGGEKTLTAIALLFGIYLVKPSPFCILDEIDAPLDDANIDRFTRILQDFSRDTQFIVVTHNKRTMESAETLYGVTMQEEGISKLVSVRFNEDFDLAAHN